MAAERQRNTNCNLRKSKNINDREKDVMEKGCDRKRLCEENGAWVRKKRERKICREKDGAGEDGALFSISTLKHRALLILSTRHPHHRVDSPAHKCWWEDPTAALQVSTTALRVSTTALRGSSEAPRGSAGLHAGAVNSASLLTFYVLCASNRSVPALCKLPPSPRSASACSTQSSTYNSLGLAPYD